MGMAEKIKIMLIKQNLTVKGLAEMLDTSPSNLSNKLSRDNFSEKELHEIAERLGCTFEGSFIRPDGTRI